jgi:UDP-3-O-[3-hydroxymyristoyl] glucosamine N-acyltransferase
MQLYAVPNSLPAYSHLSETIVFQANKTDQSHPFAQFCRLLRHNLILMQFSAQQIATLLGGTVEGNPDVVVQRPMRIEEAGPGDFAFFDNPKYEHYAYTTGASVLMVSDDFKPVQAINSTLLRVPNVRVALATLLGEMEKLQQGRQQGGISPQAWVDPSAQVHPTAVIGPFAVVEAQVIIGRDTTVHAQAYIGAHSQLGQGTVVHTGAKIYGQTVIGDECIIHANAVIGADGFGFAPEADGSWRKVPHVGNVVIEHLVEVGAGSCIDRASIGSTILRTGVKIDNLVHIAHNVEVGAHTVMAAQVGVAGSTKIGAHCMLGGQTGIAGHLILPNGTRTQAQSGVGSNLKEPGKALFGSPAIDYNDYVRSYIVFKQLPEMAREMRALAKKIKGLEEKTTT